MIKLLVSFLSAKYRFKRYSSQKIQQYQEKKMQKVVNFAIKNSKFYRDYYKDLEKITTKTIWTLPTINKEIFMDNFDDLNTVGLSKQKCVEFCLQNEKTRNFSRKLDGYTIGMSSGTSGNKGLEVVSANEEQLFQTLFFSRFPMLKNEKLNVAFILRVFSPGFNASRYGHKVKYVSPLRPIEEIVAELNKQKPNILSAPPSMLEILSQELVEERLQIKPKRLISYAEVLTLDVKTKLEKRFQADVHEIYKCTEGAIAMSCQCGKLHINEDIIVAELLDQNGNPTPPGEPSHRFIVTDLIKRATPIIRYELNDIVTIDPEPCHCGSNFRVIKQIQGRKDDIFHAPRQDKEEMQFIFPDYIRRSIISSSNQIKNYQAFQKNPETIEIKLELIEDVGNKKKSDIIQNIIKNIKNVYEHYHCKTPIIDIQFESISYNSDRKFRRIQRLF